MPRSRAPYPKEFRAEAVRLYRESDKSLKDVATELGVAMESLRTRPRSTPGSGPGSRPRSTSRVPSP